MLALRLRCMHVMPKAAWIGVYESVYELGKNNMNELFQFSQQVNDSAVQSSRTNISLHNVANVMDT